MQLVKDLKTFASYLQRSVYKNSLIEAVLFGKTFWKQDKLALFGSSSFGASYQRVGCVKTERSGRYLAKIENVKAEAKPASCKQK